MRVKTFPMRSVKLLGVVAVMFGCARTPPPPHSARPTATATFALGCFWGPEARLGALPGVVRSRVGYCGGQAAKPVYFALGDHSEAVQIDFDPAQISYSRLLQEARQLGDFGSKPLKRQYRSAVFAHDAEQAREARQAGISEVEPLGKFHLAEESQQKHFLQQETALAREIRPRFGGFSSFNDSTQACQGNALAAGCYPPEKVRELLPQLSLSPASAELLLRRASEPLPPGCGVRPVATP